MVNKEIAMPPLPEEEIVEKVTQDQETTPDMTPETTPVSVTPVSVTQGTTLGSQISMVENQGESDQEMYKKQGEETSQQVNFKALRLEKERLERENFKALKQIEELQRKAQKPDEDMDLEISDDDLFEGKHYKKIQRQLKKQKEDLEQYQAQIKMTTTEAKLKAQYSDFDKVVNEETIKRLTQEEPEIADTISSTQNLYSKAVSAYKMIKKLGIYVEDNYAPDRNVVQRNSLRPKASASVSPQQGDSPLTRANEFANGLTPELKKQLWREMEESAKGN